jgi:hypothetical protein
MLYMVILPESELRKRSIPNLLLIEQKARRLIGRIQGSGLTRGSVHSENDQTVSAYKEYIQTLRRLRTEALVS